MMRCAACQVEMEQGFIPDFGTMATWVAVWAAGTPATAKSMRERIKTGGGVSLADAEVKAIDAFRCPQCGRIELRATQGPAVGQTPAAR